jgi:hypothetical protein
MRTTNQNSFHRSLKAMKTPFRSRVGECVGIYSAPFWIIPYACTYSEMNVEGPFRFFIPVVFYANEGGWVRQNTTVVGSYLLAWRRLHVSAVLGHLQVITINNIKEKTYTVNFGWSGMPSSLLRTHSGGWLSDGPARQTVTHQSVLY